MLPFAYNRTDSSCGIFTFSTLLCYTEALVFHELSLSNTKTSYILITRCSLGLSLWIASDFYQNDAANAIRQTPFSLTVKTPQLQSQVIATLWQLECCSFVCFAFCRARRACIASYQSKATLALLSCMHDPRNTCAVPFNGLRARRETFISGESSELLLAHG